MNRNLVRVGWYTSTLFQEGGQDGTPKSGYGYTYLRKVADYAGWDYEYVYGEWPELFEMLQDGRIDVMAGVSATDERRKSMLFPSTAMGTDKYYLYKRSDDTSISVMDLSTFSGKKIGVIDHNRMSEYALEWAEKNDVDVEFIYYDGISAMDEALASSKVDLVPRTLDSSSDSTDITPVVNLGEEPYYLALSVKKPYLLPELNAAVNTLTSVDPYLLMDLQYETYGTTLAAKTLTSEEKLWLIEHPTIRIGYMDNYLPYCATDEDGQATGLMTDVVGAAISAMELKTIPDIEYIAYSGYGQIVEALKSGDIDLAFPVANDLWRLEEDGICASTEVISDRGALFYRVGRLSGNFKKLAVNGNNILQIDYTKSVFPDAELVYYPTIKDGLDGVLKGEADATIMDTLRVQYVTSQSEYYPLTYVQLSEGTGKCFGIAQDNAALLLLINRGVKALGSSYGYNSSYKYMDAFYSFGLLDFIKANIIPFIMISGILIVVIVLTMTTYIKHQRREILEKEELKKKAEQASASKSMFLFNMSHDIRTPMNAVLGFTELIDKEAERPDKVREYISKIRLSGEYLMNLINNVLEVARIDSGKETVDEGFMDLLGNGYLVIFENEIKKKKLTMKMDADVTHRYVFTDAHKIREIYMNLVSNAIKYTPDGGFVTLGIKEYPCEKPGYATYVATVSDTGIGMTKEFQEHIFELFSREKNSTDSKVMGTGLGTSIIKKLVDLLGGTVTVESEPGKGSTFTVTFDFLIATEPEKYLEAAAKEAEDLEQVDLNGRRILLAEDNELNAEIAVTLLESYGADVELAVDGVECVDMVSSHEGGYYDLILMDIQMPRLNGYLAARKIRGLSDSSKASIPIVAMTANAFDEDRKAAMDAGMNEHLAKPLDIRALTRVLGKMMKKE